MLQPCPAPRPGPQPRFAARVLPSSPLFRPVPRRASEYSKPIPSAASQPNPVRAHCGSTAGPPSATPTASQSTATAYRFQEMPLRKQSQGPSGFVTQKDVHSETRAKALQLWQNMRSVLLPLSGVLQELSGSSHPESLEERLLSGVSETTLLRYLQGFKGFLHALHTLDRALDSSLRQVDIADALLAMHNMGTHVLTGLKSLRWAQKTLLLSLPDLYQGLMHSVSYRVESDRKEAFPLPLFVLAALERQLLLDMGSPARLLFIGAVLTSCWSSLRLSDSQHVSWSSIQAGSWCTRGTSYRTKVSRRGVPFGFLNEGFYSAGRSFACTWVARYLRLLGEEWDALEASFGSVTPDCLFFSSAAGEFQPLTYGEVLNQLRGLLISIGLRTEEAGTFTVHSMKVCLLSVMAQRGFRVSRREAQGHHKSSSHSAKLYSRDDVWPALAAQKSLMRSISQGWWPSTPLARGGRHPVPQRAIAHPSLVRLHHTNVLGLLHPLQLMSLQTPLHRPRRLPTLLMRFHKAVHARHPPQMLTSVRNMSSSYPPRACGMWAFPTVARMVPASCVQAKLFFCVLSAALWLAPTRFRLRNRLRMPVCACMLHAGNFCPSDSWLLQSKKGGARGLLLCSLSLFAC